MYMDSFEVGDIVSPLKRVVFMDGTTHEIGQEYEIKEGCCAYYNVCGKDYKLVRSIR